jgi:hypothetical protein
MNTARRPAPVATSCRPPSRLEADSPSRAPDASCCGQQLGGPSTRTISATRGRRRRRACCEGGNPRRRGCKGPVDPAAARALPADDLGRAGLASAETWRPTGVKPSLEGGGAGFSVTNFRTLRGAAASLSSRKATSLHQAREECLRARAGSVQSALCSRRLSLPVRSRRPAQASARVRAADARPRPRVTRPCV